MPDEQRDFFISFNSADEAYAKAISDALRAEGFTTFFHPDDLEFGGYIPKWMNDALLNSRQMLALCSPEYMAEGAVYSEAERYAWFWRDTRGEKFKLIPVVLKEVEFPPLLAVYKRLMVTDTTPVQAAAAIVTALKKPEEIKEREILRGTQPKESLRRPAYVHTTRLPETGYERLVGRDAELKRLDKAWLDTKINILSLVAEGGAGKSALVNEWIKRMQAHNYPGAEAVLGWSFYSQGTERAASAEEFLNWAIEKLGITLATPSASAKADAIAEAMMRRRVLLLLDGVEPLQHGPGPQLGQLKDLGLRALLRRFAATPPGATHGVIVLTSRLEVKDLTRWRDVAAPTDDINRLSDAAGAALLRDNGVEGIDKNLEVAARDFGGHPLALGLLANFLKETQSGDVRRRDHIRSLVSDTDNPGHDHAKRVMESYEREWLAGQPVLLAIMYMVGLFDRPASADCLNALRGEPAIDGLTEQTVKLGDSEWRRAVARLREAKLLAPPDPSALDGLDAHPLVREWFGERLRQDNESAWKKAHGRLYEHLRDTTEEGTTPTLEDLAPLYQAIAHGCRAERYQEALIHIFMERLVRLKSNGEFEGYTSKKLGAIGSNLAALSWFFAKPYETPVVALRAIEQTWTLNEAGMALKANGRFVEAVAAMRAALQMYNNDQNWLHLAISGSNLSQTELLLGEVAAAVATAKQAVAYAKRTKNSFQVQTKEVTCADALHAAGQCDKAERLFASAERRQKKRQPEYPYLHALMGYFHWDLLLSKREFEKARDRAVETLEWTLSQNWILDVALSRLISSRANCGLLIQNARNQPSGAAAQVYGKTVAPPFDQAIEDLGASGFNDFLPRGLLARDAFRRNVGDWHGAARDLDEVEEIAEPGPMRLYLCDMALERARLAFAQIEAFAPLNGLIEDSPPKPVQPSEGERKGLREEAAKQLVIAADYIEKCDYHRRDDEIAELQAVLRGERTFASLSPRV
jgi:tetratricopeptide (TPR) repeat protein